VIYIGDNPGVPMMEISDSIQNDELMTSIYELSKVHRVMLLPRH